MRSELGEQCGIGLIVPFAAQHRCPCSYRWHMSGLTSDEPRPNPGEIEAALRMVPGVDDAEVNTELAGGASADTLRLTLAPGADEVAVAHAVQRILRMHFGVGLDGNNIELVEDSYPETVTASATAPILQVVTSSPSDDDANSNVLPLDRDIAALLARLDAASNRRPETQRFENDVLRSAMRHPSGGNFDNSVAAPAAVADVAQSASVNLTPPMSATSRPAAAGHSQGQTAPNAGGNLDPRLAIARLTMSADGLGMTATVTLSRAGMEHTGIADGPGSGAAVNRTVALATVNAISAAMGSGQRLDVDAVLLTQLGAERVAVVQVTRITPSGAERLTGASEVREDVRQAVIRATLDAVNRRLAPLFDHY